jgi:LAO/AO transport system kinase
VDPSSPLTRGALLGDRVRLSAEYGDDVFFRSMASRGSVGGLSAATCDALLLLDAAGYEVILVETVGAGQGELAVAQCADVVVLVLTPNSGDLIQAMKAGVAEMADLIVINKADLPGAAGTRRNISQALHWRSQHRLGREPEVLTASAEKEEGTDALVAAISAAYAHLQSSGLLMQRRRARLEYQVGARIREAIWERSQADLARDPFMREQIDRVLRQEVDPYSAAEIVLQRYIGAAGAADE